MEALPSFGITLMSVITVICLIHSKIAMSKVPQSVPWAGLRKEVLSETRACIRELKAGLRTLKTGYNQFSRKGLPFITPSPEMRPIVIVPPEHVVWMSDKPDNVLSARKTQVGRFAIDYLCPGLDINHDAFMMGAVRKDLTRNLGRMQPAMIEDIRSTIDQAMGLDDCSWKEVCITKAMEHVIFRSTSRVLVGSPLCTNEEYLRCSIAFATWLGGAAILVGQYTPWMMKPFLGYLGALPIYYYKQKAMKFLLPVVRDRMANIKRKRADPSFDFEEPKDFITWITQAVLDNPETKDSPPEFLGTRLLFFTLGAIHTTIMTATNTMLDLVSSNPDARFWEQLREEAAGVFTTADDWTNPASLPKLPLADSTIREGLRQNPMLTQVILHEVMPKDGVTLPSGHHIPKGAWMSAGVVDLHHDDRFYPKPEEFDPFRFAKRHEETPAGADKEALTDKASIYRKNQGLATASDIFLAFSYGKHACPGRWLVAHQLKLLLAYVTLNYDIQYIAQRPVNQVFGDSLIPSRTATMMVRRRKHT